MTRKNKLSKKSAKVTTTTQVVVAPRQQNRPKKKKSGQRQKRATFDIQTDSWLATLVDPFGVHGVRIPDDTVAPSATATFRDRFTVTALAGTGSTYAAGFVFVPTLVSAMAKGANYTTGTDVVWGPYVGFSQQGTFSGLSRQWRVVSAGLAVYGTNAMAKNQGRNLCAFYPGSDNAAMPIPTSVAAPTLLIAENSEDSPLNQQMICSIVWVPSDVSNYRYHPNGANAFASAGTPNYYNPGTLVWMADGLDSSASFEVVCTLNVEYLPNTNALSFTNVLPSFYNQKAMERALNSRLVSNMFHSADPESIIETQGSNNLGISNFVGSVWSTFGSGARSIIQPITYKLGQAAAMAGINRLAKYTRAMPVGRSLLGIDN